MNYPGRMVPNDPPLLPTPAAVAERERASTQLSLHYAAGQISMTELESRLTRVYQSQSSDDLDDLLADLPMLSTEKLDAGMVAALVPTSAVPARGVLMAFMSGVSRTGSWVVPRELKVFAFMGGAELDLREAKFAPGVTEIDVACVMGGIEILVPRGVRVEVLGGAFMGGFVADAGDAGALDPAQPVLRVSGFVVMGGVDVTVKKPGKRVLARFEAAVNATRRLMR